MKKLIFTSAYVLGLIVVAILTTNVSMYVATRASIVNSVVDAPRAEVVLIPGAAIYPDGSLSPIFLDRINLAVEIYKAGKVSKILVSGDNSTTGYNEVNPVRLYLIGKGIPAEDIFLDHAGFDTYSSMYRARDIFGVTSVLIVSQSFHLPRAVFIAHALGLKAYGVNADVGHILLRNYAREVLADEKAVFDLVLHVKPKFLGEKILIMGDGQSYL